MINKMKNNRSEMYRKAREDGQRLPVTQKKAVLFNRQ